ncbi:hypothetical protein [Cognatilysobacter segetis]|uniref:hypothetical protein n=1 Tax=Cognatilysobacter segetis TaxID=2492394 RepID=UPI00105B34C1|nr:hypothetical protein [Lysobacter segetis]
MRRALVLSIALFAPPAMADGLPVLSAYPGCDYERLGTVAARDGRRPDGSADDARLRMVDYGRTFERLGVAGAERGANALVVNLHEAAFYTTGGRRSARPVYLSMTAAAIRLRDPAACAVAVIDPDALQQRALHGELQPITLEPWSSGP